MSTLSFWWQIKSHCISWNSGELRDILSAVLLFFPMQPPWGHSPISVFLWFSEKNPTGVSIVFPEHTRSMLAVYGSLVYPWIPQCVFWFGQAGVCPGRQADRQMGGNCYLCKHSLPRSKLAFPCRFFLSVISSIRLPLDLCSLETYTYIETESTNSYGICVWLNHL